MIAAGISIYTVGAIVCFCIIAIVMVVAQMFGSVSMSDYAKAAVASLVWPIVLGWVILSWAIHKCKGRKVNGF
jgi:hypothetical protein